ncbi:hypothetical protein XELAEV_18002826mg [Xenopus laevis]|nr:hypothetical protein XELAEV_18002826mg [Xenopus laevis]
MLQPSPTSVPFSQQCPSHTAACPHLRYCLPQSFLPHAAAFPVPVSQQCPSHTAAFPHLCIRLSQPPPTSYLSQLSSRILWRSLNAAIPSAVPLPRDHLKQPLHVCASPPAVA